MRLSHLLTEALGRSVLRFGPSAEASAAEVLEPFESAVGPMGRSRCFVALLTNDAASVGLTLSCVCGGATLVSVPAPGRNPDVAAYAGTLNEILREHDADAVVSRQDLAELLNRIGVPAIGHEKVTHAFAVADPNGFSLIQYSSGSTGEPRPVLVSDDALGVNIDAMLNTIAPRSGDVVVSWLPLSHDMGLVGTMLTGIVAGNPAYAGQMTVVCLQPESFLRRPALWIEVLSNYRCNITAAPDFGYRLAIANRPTSAVDLTPLRVAIVGGEVVRSRTLHTFEDIYGPSGFPSLAFCPAYGMAELGLCATFTPPGNPWRESLSPPAEHLGARGPIVSSGPAIAGCSVRQRQGRIDAIDTIEVLTSNFGVDLSTGLPFGQGGWYAPGDIGFIDDDGWVYVCGRVDDVIVANGRNLSALTIEDAVGDVDGIRAGRVLALNAPTGGWFILAESDSAGSSSAISRIQRTVARASVGVVNVAPEAVYLVPRGSLPITTSGKLRRSAALRRWLEGKYTREG